jgi:hypothetical protein
MAKTETAYKPGEGSKREAVVKLAMRKGGVTRSELITATGWKVCPWRWTFSNPQKTGLADRITGLKFWTEETDAGVTYHLERKPAAAPRKRAAKKTEPASGK